MQERIADVGFPRAAAACLLAPPSRKAALRCIAAASKDFFFFQLGAAASKGSIPIVNVEHPLDQTIPFRPRMVVVYLDFIPFWTRTAYFLIKRYGRSGVRNAASYIDGMARLYGYAASVYRRHLSTTKRPSFLLNPHFAFIHLTDPHLLCIPSLHVMVVIRAYTHFRALIRERGQEAVLADKIALMRNTAIEITEAVLYVKQHSVNCVSASMYTMTRFEPELFPVEEAERFAQDLFRSCRSPGKEEAEAIRQYILNLYRNLLEEGRSSQDWRKPVFNFLTRQPRFC